MPADRFARLKTPLPSEESLDSTPMADFKGLAFLGLRGHDSISRCFEFDISAISGTADIDANEVLGEDVILAVSTDPDMPDRSRFFHGIVDGFRFAGADEEGHWLYHLILRPKLWLLSKASDNRIFQDMTVVDIVSEVLDQHGCSDYEWNLNGKPPTREYCVQYGETDLNFVQRLLEHEGIFYYFRFEDGKHVLVFSDDLQLLDPAEKFEKLPYRESSLGHYASTGAITRFSRVDSIVSGSHSLTDYDFEKPSADLMTLSDNALAHSNADRARYSYPGNYIEFGRGDALAKIRNQEDQAHALVITALSTAAAPASGNVFTLEEFPRDSDNTDYAIESVTYDIRSTRFRSRTREGAQPPSRGMSIDEALPREAQGGGFSAIYRLIPQSVSYQPAQVTPRAVMKGPQTAVVVGPSGEEIYTDKYSRVKVQFHWDRKGKKDENTTCFIRVSSAWAGAGWGFIQIPRIGQEVIVDFLEGDPDQPIVTGRVYNAEQMPPYALPGNATQSGWKSNSSPGGGGWNELRFEDKKGSEEVYFQAEKDHNELVKNNEARHIGNDFSEEVVNDATQWVGHDRTESVDNNKSTTVGVDRVVSIGNDDTETVGNNRSLSVRGDESIDISGDSDEKIWKGHSQYVLVDQKITVGGLRLDNVGGHESRKVGAWHSTTVVGYRTVTVGEYQKHGVQGDDGWEINGKQDVTIKKDQTFNIGGTQSFFVDGEINYIAEKKGFISTGDDMSISTKKKLAITAADEIAIVCGSAAITMKKDGTITIEGKDVTTKGSGKINVKADSDVTITGSKINQN